MVTLNMFDYTKISGFPVQIAEDDNSLRLSVGNSTLKIHSFDIDNKNIQVIIDAIKIDVEDGKKVCRIAGWAAEFDYRLPVKSILIVRGDKIIAIVKKMNFRSDVAQHISSFVDTFGFGFSIPYVKNDDDVCLYMIRPSDKVHKHTLSLP